MTEQLQAQAPETIDDSFASIEEADGRFEDFDDGDFEAPSYDGDDEDAGQTALDFDDDDDLPPAPALVERLCGLIAAVFLTAFFMLVQGTFPSDLFQPLPILLVTGVVLGGLIASHGPRMVYSLLGIALGMKALDGGEARALHDMCQQGRRLCYVGGLLQLVTSTMSVLSTLESPILFGAPIAAALTGIVYATLLAELGLGSVKNWIRTCLY